MRPALFVLLLLCGIFCYQKPLWDQHEELFVVMLKQRTGNPCTGSMITCRWILSSASCFAFPKKSIHVFSTNMNHVLGYIIGKKDHPSWATSSRRNARIDLSLFMTKQPITISPVATLPQPNMSHLRLQEKLQYCFQLSIGRKDIRHKYFPEKDMWKYYGSGGYVYYRLGTRLIATDVCARGFGLAVQDLEGLLCTNYYPGIRRFAFGISGSALVCDGILEGVGVLNSACGMHRCFYTASAPIRENMQWISTTVKMIECPPSSTLQLKNDRLITFKWPVRPGKAVVARLMAIMVVYLLPWWF